MKKIGWMKFTGNIEIGEHLLFTTGNTDLRTKAFDAILQSGIELQLYTPISKDTKDFLESEEGKRRFGKIVLKETFTPDKDLDLLIVENGTDNTNFSWRYKGEEIPSVAYANSIISNYKGLVFYMQTDPDLPFVFFPEYLSLKFANQYLGYGNCRSILEDKKWVILTCCRNIDDFRKTYSGIRFSYDVYDKSGFLDFDNLEIHYGCLDAGREQNLKIKKRPEFGISYVGGQRKRNKKIDEFFLKPAKAGIPVNIFGKWKETFTKNFPEISWEGVLGRGLVHETYNNSFGTVVIGDPRYEDLGFVSGRFFEAISSKTLPLIDSKLLGSAVSEMLSDELLKELLVKDGDDIIKKYKRLNNTDERVDLIKQVQKETKKFDSFQIVEDLGDLVDKYGDSPVNRGKEFRKELGGILKTKMKERKETNLFNRLNYDMILRQIHYNVKGEHINNLVLAKVFNAPEFNTGKCVDYDGSSRCSRCGQKQDLTGKSVYVSNSVCEDCRNGVGDFDERLRANFKKVRKYLEKNNG